MRLTFKMTPDDYFEGFILKTKICKIKNRALPIIPLIIGLILDASLFLQKELYYGFAMLGLLILFAVLSVISYYKRKVYLYENSVILTGRHTIVAEEDSLQILNSFEKMVVPWNSVYYVKLTKDLLIIIPTYRKGLVVINRNDYSGDELDNIIDFIKSKVDVKGVNDEKHI